MRAAFLVCTSYAELTFFAPDQDEMERICAAIREEIKSFKEELRIKDKEGQRTRKN